MSHFDRTCASLQWWMRCKDACAVEIARHYAMYLVRMARAEGRL